MKNDNRTNAQKIAYYEQQIRKFQSYIVNLQALPPDQVNNLSKQDWTERTSSQIREAQTKRWVQEALEMALANKASNS